MAYRTQKVVELVRSALLYPATTAITVFFSAAGLGLTWLVLDYRAWVAFGTGGTPPTPAGYWKITKFRIRRALSSDHLTDHTPLHTSGPTYLRKDLPRRQGPRPSIIARTLPQRQHPQPLGPEVKQRLHDLPAKYQAQYADILTLDRSITEGRSTDAIYAKPNLLSRHPSAKDDTLGDEIAHVHPAENSLHVWLSESDARTVVAAGWGERFPLSSLSMVHNGWTFVYAPRSMEEADVVEEIVKAGIGYLTGVMV